MMNIRWALQFGVLSPCLLAISAGACASSDSSGTTGQATTSGSAGSHQNITSGGVSSGMTGGFATGAGSTGPSSGGTGGGAGGNCTPPMVVTAMPTSDLLTNLDLDSAVSGFSPGGGWFSYKDMEPTGMLTPENALFTTEGPGANQSAAAVHVVGSGFMPDLAGQNYGGGVGFSLASPRGTPGDLSGASGFSFYAKSGKTSDLSDIKIAVSTTGTDPTFCQCNATGCYDTHFTVLAKVPTNWTQFTVKWDKLEQAGWGYKVGFDPKTVLTIQFVSNGALSAFDFWVDEVSLVH